MIVEDGSGIFGANSYAALAEANAYFTERGNILWPTLSDAAKMQAMIKATDYIEKRFGRRFQGTKEFPSKLAAQVTLTFTGNPAPLSSFSIGGEDYIFNTGFTDSRNVQIETKVGDTVKNLVAAINSSSGNYAADIDKNASVSAELLTGRKVLFTATYDGEDGNDITAVVGDGSEIYMTFNFQTLNGGSFNGVSQSLSFPRVGCFNDYIEITGVPVQLKWAQYEFAVRAAEFELMPDPEVDASGRIIVGKTEKVGPIEDTVKYSGFAAIELAMGSYPAAETILRPLLGSGNGGVSR